LAADGHHARNSGVYL